MLATALQVVGAVAVTIGVALIYLPAGLIVGGVLITVFGLAIERGR